MVPEGAAKSPGVLNSWKEIAAYLNRDVRTVMRWEQTRGLPVHRLPGGPKSAVYALKSELEAWRKGRKPILLDPEEEFSQPAAPHWLGRKAKITALALGCIVLAAAAVVAVRRLAHKPSGTAGLPSMTRLTYERFAGYPTISADGKLFAYTSDREGTFDVYVQQIGGHQPIRVTRNDADNWHPALSPDGLRIAFRSDRDGGGLYLVETLGGAERKIADRGDFPDFSPDGSSIAYLVRNPFGGRAKMFLIGAAGGSPRPFQPEFDVPPIATAFTVPMWSPDGQHILFDGARGGDPATRGLWIAPVGGGPAARLEGLPPNRRGTFRAFLTWAGGYLYYIEGTSVQGTPLIRVPIAPNPWRVAGPPVPLTSPSTVCGSTRVSAGGRLVLMVASALADAWSMPLPVNPGESAGPLRQETSGTESKLAMSVAADGSMLAYTGVFEVGHLEIRLMDLATRRLSVVPLSGNSLGSAIRLSADGSHLAYSDSAGGKLVAFSVAAANPALADTLCEACSPAAYFSRSQDLLLASGPHLVRQDLSGARTNLIDAPATDPALSPDDRWLAFVAPKPNGFLGLFVAAVGRRPVPPAEWISVAEDRNLIGSPQWSRAENVLYYLSNRDSFTCVWSQLFDARSKKFGEPVHIYHNRGFPSLKVNPARSMAITPNRMYLFMVTMSSNIWTMKVDAP